MFFQKMLNPRWQSIARLLSWSDPLHKWRISKSFCPNCGGKYFLVMRPDAFMIRCLSCRANGTNLSLIPLIEKHRKSYPVREAWEMSTYGATLSFLRTHVDHVYESEYFEGKRSGEIVDGILNQDVQETSFSDSSLDLITSNQVFEHVPDDIKGYAECFRVLRPGGALLFTVPLYGIRATEKLAEIRAGELIYFTKPEYHDSRTAGPESILTFWHHSVNDIGERVSSVGFDVTVEDVFIAPYPITATKVVRAVKPISPPPTL
jgi:SAM-dependent methyltransferase